MDDFERRAFDILSAKPDSFVSEVQRTGLAISFPLASFEPSAEEVRRPYTMLLLLRGLAFSGRW